MKAMTLQGLRGICCAEKWAMEAECGTPVDGSQNLRRQEDGGATVTGSFPLGDQAQCGLAEGSGLGVVAKSGVEKAMKILVLNGSPKRDKSDTMHVTRAFLEAVAATGPRLELVRRAGREYVERGEVGEALAEEIGLPMIPEETYAAIVNGER